MGAALRTAVAVVTLATLAACTRSDQVATVASTDVPVTVATIPPPTAVAPTTVPATTAAPTTAAATTTPTTAPTTTPAPATAAPTTPPLATVPVLNDGVVLVQWGRTPLGVWDGSAWRVQEWGPDFLPIHEPTVTGLVATGLDLAAPITGLSFGPLDYYCVGDERAPSVELPTGVDTGEARFIAVTADWDVQPRGVAQVGLDNPEYQALGESLVDTSAGADPAAGDVTQAVRADLDGDGIEEVLLAFEHQSDDGGFGAAGDYTLLIVRYPHADGTVDDTVLWSFYEEAPIDFPSPGTGSLLAVADLNGDGVMEVVVQQMYWETVLAEIYALVDGRLTMVAGGGCGV